MLFFPLLLLIPIADTCLNLQYPATTTPSLRCACVSIPIDGSNIRDFVPSTHPFFPNLTQSTLTKATIDASDCSATFSCPSDHNILGVDDTKGVVLGKGQMYAYCDLSTQTWLVDDGINDAVNMKRIYVTCTDSSPQTPTRTTQPPDELCIFHPVEGYNKREILAMHPMSEWGYFEYPLVRGSRAAMKFWCRSDSNLHLTYFDMYNFASQEFTTLNLTCDRQQRLWRNDATNETIHIRDLVVSCVDFTISKPTGCPCNYVPVDHSNLNIVGSSAAIANLSSVYISVPMISSITSDLCVSGQLFCRNFGGFSYQMMNLEFGLDQMMSTNLAINMTCDHATHQWSVAYNTDGFPPKSYKTYTLMTTCVDYTKPANYTKN